MKVEVLQGTVQHNGEEYGVGQFVKLPESEAKILIREGVVGLAEDKSKVKPEPVKENAKTEIVKEEEEEEVEEAEAPKPSMDWTKSELVEAADSKGLEVQTKMTKAEILELLRG